MSDIPQKMTALLQTGDGYSGTFEGPAIDDASKYLEIAEIDVPTPGPGQVLIRLRVSSVNPSDLHFIKGEYGQPRIKGKPAGFEGCGDVVAAGEGAEGLAGKRVAFISSPNGSGAWADYAMTDAMLCIPLRPNVSDEDGSAQIVNPMTAMAMVDIARQAGDSFVISAATSQLGKLMTGLGRDLGLKPIALVRRPEAVDALMEMGAEKVLLTSADDFDAQFKATSKELKPRVFLDAVGDQVSESAFGLMPNGSRWVIYGLLSSTPPTLNMAGQIVFKGKKIEGFWLTDWMRATPPQDQFRVVQEVQARFADGRWKTDVSAHVPLRHVLDGLADALKKTDGKVMITP